MFATDVQGPARFWQTQRVSSQQVSGNFYTGDILTTKQSEVDVCHGLVIAERLVAIFGTLH